MPKGRKTLGAQGAIVLQMPWIPAHLLRSVICQGLIPCSQDIAMAQSVLDQKTLTGRQRGIPELESTSLRQGPRLSKAPDRTRIEVLGQGFSAANPAIGGCSMLGTTGRFRTFHSYLGCRLSRDSALLHWGHYA